MFTNNDNSKASVYDSHCLVTMIMAKPLFFIPSACLRGSCQSACESLSGITDNNK